MARSDGLSPLQSRCLSPLASQRRARLRYQCLRPSPLALRRMRSALLRHPGRHSLHAPRPLLSLRQSRFATHLRPLRRGRIQVSLAASRHSSLPLPQLPPAPLFLATPQTRSRSRDQSDFLHRLIPSKSPSQLSFRRASPNALQYPVRGERFSVAVFQLQLTRAPFLRNSNVSRALFARLAARPGIRLAFANISLHFLFLRSAA
jgi:hypothetical protein